MNLSFSQLWANQSLLHGVWRFWEALKFSFLSTTSQTNQIGNLWEMALPEISTTLQKPGSFKVCEAHKLKATGLFFSKNGNHVQVINYSISTRVAYLKLFTFNYTRNRNKLPLKLHGSRNKAVDFNSRSKLKFIWDTTNYLCCCGHLVSPGQIVRHLNKFFFPLVDRWIYVSKKLFQFRLTQRVVNDRSGLGYKSLPYLLRIHKHIRSWR